MGIKMVSLSSLAIVHSEIVLNFVFFPTNLICLLQSKMQKVFFHVAFVDDGISILERPTTLKCEIEKEVFMVLYEN